MVIDGQVLSDFFLSFFHCFFLSFVLYLFISFFLFTITNYHFLIDAVSFFQMLIELHIVSFVIQLFIILYVQIEEIVKYPCVLPF